MDGAVRAVLFDMDGVLFDSMPNHAYAWSHAMTQFGLAMTAEEAYMNEGRTGSGTIDMLAQRFWGRNATEEEKQRIYAAKSALFNTLPEAKPMPGAREALEAARECGAKIVLVTGSAQLSLIEHLELHYPGFFRKELMVTAFDVKRGKPNPEPYLMGLEKAGVRAEEAVVVENAPLGVEAGRAAGIFTIAANTGPLPDEVLKQSGADIVVAGMHEVAQLLRK
ncbi:MAG: HAD-IA family hydrolase [Bacteroidaceae bacterium]|nr:HAD-IA family hydrolase [Bacteroidaceae bacterium]MBQ3958726.1 HAD-IA family hydrolase [Bacteroidaceae bacterium]